MKPPTKASIKEARRRMRAMPRKYRLACGGLPTMREALDWHAAFGHLPLL